MDINSKKNSKKKLNPTVEKLLWFIPAILCILIDQFTKELVVKKIELYQDVPVIGDFLMFTHITNKNAGFSLGSSLEGFWRLLVIYIVPIVFILGLIYIFFNADKYNIRTKIEKIAISLILGGGCGNIIDRLARKDGVVDFIKVKVGLPPTGYWLTFNAADSFVVIGVILVFIWAFIIHPIKDSKAKSKLSKAKNNEGSV